MIHFCITDDLLSVKKQYKNQFTCCGYHISYDDHVWLYESLHNLTLFCGVLWEGDIDQLLTQSSIPNGQFYYISIHKSTGIISGATDFLEDYTIYYKKDKLLFTTDLLNIRSSIDNEEITDLNLRYQDTILKDVYSIGPAQYFTYDITLHQYSYIKKSYFLNSFENTLSFDEAVEYTDNVLSQNIKKISNDYILMSGSGIDSLIIASYLDNPPIMSYLGDWWEREQIPKISENQTLITYSKDEYLQTNKDVAPFWNLPWKRYDFAPEVCIYRQRIDPYKIILNGTYGDEVFWHEPRIAMAICYYKYGLDFKDIPNFLKDKYCYNEFYFSEYAFRCIKTAGTFERAVTWHLQYRPSYLKGLRVVSDRQIFSPFIDLRLRTLLNRCDEKAQEQSCFNAEIQKQLLNPALFSVLNPYKAGTEEGSNLFTDSFNKFMQYFLENYK